MRKVNESFICDICEKDIPKSSFDSTHGRIKTIRFDIYGKDDYNPTILHICNTCKLKLGIQENSEFGHQVSKDFITFLKTITNSS